MNPILASIVSTIAFYDAVSKTPLTKVELYKYLIRQNDLSVVSFGYFLEFLDRKFGALKPAVSRCRGFYYMNSNKDGYARRVQIGKTGIQKWRIARRMTRLISLLPYVTMVAITGSLPLHATHKGSDIDMLIVAKKGHIWTVRALVSALMHVVKRRRHGRRIQDRICLNHFIADSDLTLAPQNLFSAHIVQTMICVWGSDDVQRMFENQNMGWAKSYCPHMQGQKISTRLMAKRPRVLSALCLFEGLLLTRIVEAIVRAIQIKKITQRQKEESYDGRGAIFNDAALVFHHPRPRNQEAMVLYEQHIKNLSPVYPHLST